MSTTDRPGVGSEADQLARLQHAHERHGLEPYPCPRHAGEDCRVCDGHAVVFTAGNMTPCGPSCPLNDIRPA